MIDNTWDNLDKTRDNVNDETRDNTFENRDNVNDKTRNIVDETRDSLTRLRTTSFTEQTRDNLIH